MAVVNILKSGTIVDDMSKVTVPADIMKNIVAITERKAETQKKKVKS